MSITITLLGTGSPMPNPDRAGPATLITAEDGADAEHTSSMPAVGCSCASPRSGSAPRTCRPCC
jgi:hypothetical protein